MDAQGMVQNLYAGVYRFNERHNVYFNRVCSAISLASRERVEFISTGWVNSEFGLRLGSEPLLSVGLNHRDSVAIGELREHAD